MNTTLANANNARDILGLKNRPYAFSVACLARSFANRSQGWMIVNGDDSAYWVVCPADFVRLIRAGYELAAA